MIGERGVLKAGCKLASVAVVALLLSALSCSPTKPFSRHYYAVARLDSHTSSGRIDLSWFTSTTPPPNYDIPIENAGPPVAGVVIYQSTSGPGGPYSRVASHRTKGTDSATVTQVIDGRPYWFKVIAYTPLGVPIITSRVIMTVPGPLTVSSGSATIRPMGRLSWSPDGDSIIYIQDVGFDIGEMRVLDLSTFSSHELGSAGPPPRYVSDAEWSPDGAHVAYTATPSRTAGSIDYRIWVANRDTDVQSSVSLGRVDFNGTWAGANRVYYCRGTYDPPNIYEIWRADVGSEAPPQAVTHDQRHRKFHPSARASDELLVFDGVDTRTYDRSLYLCQPTTGAVSVLTHESWCADSSPSWTPNGTRVVFSSDRSGHSEIWMIDPSNGSLSQLTRSERGRVRTYARVSPDGRRLAVVTTGLYFSDQQALEIIDLASALP